MPWCQGPVPLLPRGWRKAAASTRANAQDQRMAGLPILAQVMRREFSWKKNRLRVSHRRRWCRGGGGSGDAKRTAVDDGAPKRCPLSQFGGRVLMNEDSSCRWRVSLPEGRRARPRKRFLQSTNSGGRLRRLLTCKRNLIVKRPRQPRLVLQQHLVRSGRRCVDIVRLSKSPNQTHGSAAELLPKPKSR